MFYIFHGEEDFTRSEEIARFRQAVAEDGMGDLNIVTLDGTRISLNELLNAANTLPFLTQRRLVIVEDFLQRFERRRSGKRGSAMDGDDAERLLEYLPHVPDTTRLVFVESSSLGRSNPVLKGAADIPDGHIHEFEKLNIRRGDDMRKLRAWIAQRAGEKGASIDQQAIGQLITYLGNDLRQIDRELEKLAGRANYARAITAEDVNALVSAAQESNIFEMVDSIGLKQPRQSLAQLHALLDEGASELYLLSMMERQFRLILGVKDLAEHEQMNSDAIRRAMRISHRFIVDKLLQQSRQFGFEELEGLLEHTLDIDQGIKTGRIEPTLALEMLVLEACRPSRAPAPGAAHQSRRVSRRR